MSADDEVIFTISSPVSEVAGPITLHRRTWEQHIAVSHPEVSEHFDYIEPTVETPGEIYESKSQPGSYLFVSDSVATPRSGAPLTVIVGTAGSETIVKSALFHRNPTAGRLIYTGSGVEGDNGDDQS